ncbi:hypothetical protein L596_025732 [Steinernema carpocapsae]|uniref:Uncharacterized protein n=1 Tax=Steinernema carpocapsae TaxID=34508 RepID=A0A4U5M9L2_STECR|nr:hypothetical protein L596_025732 [Steinernema carpocapsae]
MLSGRVGLGGAHLGYIVVTGNTSEQEGSALVGMLLAADPSKTDRFPTISLDKELGLMEAKIKEVNEDFYIWPKAIPMVTKKRIYFPVCRRYDLQLYFHADHLACIELGKSGLTPAVQETTAIEDLEGYYNINDANMMVQRGSCTWLTFIQPGSDDDWRWNLQYYAVIGCTFLLRYVGGFTLWMSRYDRGSRSPLRKILHLARRAELVP